MAIDDVIATAEALGDKGKELWDKLGAEGGKYTAFFQLKTKERT